MYWYLGFMVVSTTIWFGTSVFNMIQRDKAKKKLEEKVDLLTLRVITLEMWMDNGIHTED